MIRRVAIYGRYSTDRQSEASAEDQARLCRERAYREGWQIVGEYLDAALSGATRDRPRLNAMLASAAEFDIVLCESLDRLSRDQEDIAAIHKRLRFAGVDIVTLADGAVGEIHIGLKGTMAALFLKDLGDKTRRGQIGRVEAGRIPGGISYGYEKVAALDVRGEPERGLRRVREDQAVIVRRIFDQFRLGVGPKEIARQLNAEAVPAPRGALWRASTITGHRTRRNGILYNDLYAGRICFNRQTFLRDPETRKRVARSNPRHLWRVQEVPELRIVDEATFAAVQAMLDRASTQPLQKRRRPKRLLSGLLTCGECGGSVVIRCGEQWGCANAVETGTCANRRLTLNGVIERRVLAGLIDSLLDPALVREYVAAYHVAMKEQAAQHRAQDAAARKRFRETDATVKRLTAAIAAGIDVTEVRDQLMAAAAERDAQAAQMREEEATKVVALHPRLADTYRKRIVDLGAELAGNESASPEARQTLRSLIDQIVVTPRVEGRGVDLEVHGRLAGMLAFAQKKAPAEARADYTVEMVAGAGFEPATFRL